MTQERTVRPVARGRARLAALARAMVLAVGLSGTACLPAAAQPGDADGELPVILSTALSPWIGDFDAMIERGLIRVAIPVGLATYFIDGADQSGITYDFVRAFEEHLKKTLGKQARNLTVAVLPARPGEILDMVVEGRADIAAGTLTITPERALRVDFSDPFRTDVTELVITGPGTNPAASLDELVGTPIHVRRSSSFWTSLEGVNRERLARGEEPLTLVAADELLRTEDLMEMVGTGVIPASAIDSVLAELYLQLFPAGVVHADLPLAAERGYGWAFRKGDSKLAETLAGFVATARKGTRLGNIILSAYTGDRRWIGNALETEHKGRFADMVDIFRTKADRYGFDWLLVAAQGYQESRLDQSVRSPVGAIGVMQLMPDTARDPAVGIPDIEDLENNIHAGVKYLHHLREQYLAEAEFAEPDRSFFSFAAYNAGPGNLSKARRRAEKLGLDPTLWFDNVEIAMAQAVSSEPVIYVRNILKYYAAYKLVQAMDMESGHAAADLPADAAARD